LKVDNPEHVKIAGLQNIPFQKKLYWWYCKDCWVDCNTLWCLPKSLLWIST